MHINTGFFKVGHTVVLVSTFRTGLVVAEVCGSGYTCSSATAASGVCQANSRAGDSCNGAQNNPSKSNC